MSEQSKHFSVPSANGMIIVCAYARQFDQIENCSTSTDQKREGQTCNASALRYQKISKSTSLNQTSEKHNSILIQNNIKNNNSNNNGNSNNNNNSNSNNNNSNNTNNSTNNSNINNSNSVNKKRLKQQPYIPDNSNQVTCNKQE